MLLLYDHKCNICRNLAYKIHISTQKQVEIKALSDPESVDILRRFYPNGWSHDFYVIENGTSRKGARGLTRLMKSLGVKGMASLLSEYTAFKIVKSAHRANANGHQPSRRALMKYAAMGPVVAGLSKFAFADPFKPSAGDFTVHVAQVREGNDLEDWLTNAWRCDQCVNPTGKFGQGAMDTKQSSVDTILADTKVSLDGHTAKLLVLKKVLTTDSIKDGTPLHRVMDIYSIMLDHPRFNLVFNVGNGPATSPSGGPEQATSVAMLINHDLPVANIDFIAFENEYSHTCSRYAEAYGAGIRALGSLHRQRGSRALAQVYNEIAPSMGLVASELAKAVPDALTPTHGKVVITSLPEFMRFTTIPATVKFGILNQVACSCNLDCCCGCGSCLGCGCSLGLCFGLPPGPCNCGACLSCGCGCGACCGCGVC